MKSTKIGVFIEACSSLSSKINQINDTLLNIVIKNETSDIIVYLIGDQKNQLVSISSLYTTLWDLCLNYNKPEITSIVYPLQSNWKLKNIESIHSLYYEKGLENTVANVLQNNSIDINLFDVHSLDLDIWNDYCKPLDFENIDDIHYDHLCLGGTFDCLHPGHKILLTLACLVSNHVLIGITSQDMLKSKQNYQKIKSYEERCEMVRSFCNEINSNINLELKPLHDIYGPAIEYDYLQAIVVSLETYKGGHQINVIRESKGMKPLVVLTVNRTSKYNLSSTFIRDHFE